MLVRRKILLQDFDRLNEENQYIIMTECHDLLKAQQLKEKHKDGKRGQIVSFATDKEPHKPL